MTKSEWTLLEAARLLGEPQHRLIYLCEKRVLVPDFGEAQGRGSSRRFSARNTLEFALALKLRQVMIPVAPVAAIIHVLRAFERKVVEEIPMFRLPRWDAGDISQRSLEVRDDEANDRVRIVLNVTRIAQDLSLES